MPRTIKYKYFKIVEFDVIHVNCINTDLFIYIYINTWDDKIVIYIFHSNSCYTIYQYYIGTSEIKILITFKKNCIFILFEMYVVIK